MSEIHDAAKRGNSARVVALADADRVKINETDESGKTALHWAAQNNHTDVARCLLAKGASTKAQTSWGATPLEWAANMGNAEVAELLLEHQKNSPSFWVAAALGMLDVVKRHLESGVPAPRVVNEHPHWPPSSAYVQQDAVSDAYVVACRNGHVEVANLLLTYGACPDDRGYFGGTALHWAAINGHFEMVKTLVNAGANLEARDEHFKTTPVAWAYEGGQQLVIDYLRQHGAKVDIWQAANWGLIDVVREHLDHDPSLINAVAGCGAPLHEAASFGRAQVVELLLSRGADREVKNIDGKTPLQVALESCQADTNTTAVVQLLSN